MLNTVVIGTAFVDIKGFPFNKYDPAGRNLGEIKIIHGGVGRNIVENFANVGMPVSYAGLLDESAVGRDVARHLLEIGANLDYTLTVPDGGIGMWLVVLDENGNLAGSISKMPDTSILEGYLAERGEEIAANAEAIVLEVDMNEHIAEMMIALAKKHQKKVYSVVGNLSVVLARKDLVRQTDCFICNEIEAAKYFDLPVVKLFTPDQMLAFLPGAAKEAGIRTMVVTMGSHGSVYYDEATQVSGKCPPFPAEVIDTSGAGDAFFSGTVMGLIKGHTLQDSVQFGAILASLTVSREEANCPVNKQFFET